MIAVAGLNHKSAPIEIREKLAFDPADTVKAMKQLHAAYPDVEFVFLSTCNRVEVYCAYEASAGFDYRSLISFFSEYHHVKRSEFEPLVYLYKDGHAARHLLTVASSLDSMVIGEDQILNQVKEGYRAACTAGSSGKVLNRLFHRAFKTAKEVRTQTAIATGRVSVAGVAVELATQMFSEISKARIVVIGAGEMGELLVQHLQHAGSKSITVVNRSAERGANMAASYGIEARPWGDLAELLGQAHIVIASAAVPEHIFTKHDMERIMGRRGAKSLLIIDIGVPRNFDPSVKAIEGVYLYSMDELSGTAEENRKAREDDILKAMQIIHDDVAKFMDWLSSKDIGPLIGEMRKKFAEISESELEHFFVGPRRKAACRNVMEPMVKRLVNRLLHCVIKNVTAEASEHGPTHAAKLVRGILEQAEDVSEEPGGEGKKDS